MRRVIRRQQETEEATGTGPTVRVEFAPLVGWGKCYRSESSPQVLAILDNIWDEYPEPKPSFITSLILTFTFPAPSSKSVESLLSPVSENEKVMSESSSMAQWDSPEYADIPQLVRDVVGFEDDPHMQTLTFRLWCNPAPLNGSQPDLVVVEDDAVACGAKDLGLSDEFWAEATRID
ncbi:hypothetical protein B0H13DRAFT_1885337 [Mycena leptocephala]|nr:hypothetical protein B0H13DRAFT_1885337 [Mycena leptocephala]